MITTTLLILREKMERRPLVLVVDPLRRCLVYPINVDSTTRHLLEVPEVVQFLLTLVYKIVVLIIIINLNLNKNQLLNKNSKKWKEKSNFFVFSMPETYPKKRKRRRCQKNHFVVKLKLG